MVAKIWNFISKDKPEREKINQWRTTGNKGLSGGGVHLNYEGYEQKKRTRKEKRGGGGVLASTTG